nr:MAG TPA: hypothetical protein [Caudoviricetes sp.]
MLKCFYKNISIVQRLNHSSFDLLPYTSFLFLPPFSYS